MPQRRARSQPRRGRRPGSPPPRASGAAPCNAANWAIPGPRVGSRITAARVMRGAISLSSSSHFPLMLYSNAVKPVALPPGRAKLETKPAPTGSTTFANTIGTERVACSSGSITTVRVGHDDVGRERDQLRHVTANAIGCQRPSDSRSARCGPRSSPIPQAPARTPRRGPAIPGRRRRGHEHADAPHPLGLLRARRERPRSRRAAEQRDELAASDESCHLIPPAGRVQAQE